MAGATVKMGVDVTQFKSGMQQAQQSVKTLDAELKKNEAQLKATGDKETYLANKSRILKQELEAQKTAANNAEKALEAMAKNGVDTTSTEYQKMAAQLANAQAAMYNTQAALNNLTVSETKAGAGASQLSSDLNSISKNVSLDTVISGINSITSAMGKAGQKAIEVGKQIWDNIMDSAEYADSIDTLATRMGISTDLVQQMQYVADRFEAPAESLAKTWKKVKVNMASDSDEIKDAFAEIGVQTHNVFQGKYGEVIGQARDYMDVFWEIGDAISHMTDESEKERVAQKLLGKSWDEMAVLFAAGREEYEKALEAAPVASEEAVKQAADLNDRMKELEKSWETLKLEAIGALAPALEKAADAIAGLLDKITAYLKTDEGQEKLKKMEEAVSSLFEDLGNIDPDQVVQNFATLFENVVKSFEWISKNWGSVKDGLFAIAAGFGAMKVAELALNIAKIVSGFKTLWAGANNPMPQLPGAGSDGSGTDTVTAGATGKFVKPEKLLDTGGLKAANPILTKAGEKTADVMTSTGGIAAITLLELYPVVKKLNETAENAKLLEDTYGTDYTDARLRKKRLMESGVEEDTADTFDRITRDLNSTNGMGQFLNFIDDAGAAIEFGKDLLPTAWEAVTGKIEEGGNAIADAAQEFANKLGNLALPAPTHGGWANYDYGGGGLGSRMNAWRSHANGLWTVPWDGYPAILHRGERVMTAQENKNYTYNNNTYFGNVNLNNGLEIEALTESIDQRNRRRNDGYGC